MFRLILGQLRHRPGRATALAIGVAVSAVAFVLLTGAAKSAEVQVRGSVQSSFRPAYDVLVRPKGSRTALEQSRGLVRDNYLSGIFGGITLKQWHEIERLPGVDVAAPIANVGYTAASAHVSISLDRYLTRSADQVFRIDSSYATADGSRYPAATQYVYVTRTGVFQNNQVAVSTGTIGQLDHGQLEQPCEGFVAPAPPKAKPWLPGFKSPWEAELFPSISCYSLRTGRPDKLGSFPQRYTSHVAATLSGTFPVFLSAIDPVQEAKLVRLDKTVVSGRYLHAAERPSTTTHLNTLMHDEEGNRYVPVLAASQSYIGDMVNVQIQRLALPSGTDVPRALSSGSCRMAFFPCPTADVERPPAGSSYRDGLGFVRNLPGRTLATRTLPFDELYKSLLAGAPSQENALTTVAYWAGSDVHYQQRASGVLQPVATTNPESVYETRFGNAAWPWDNRDVQFRKLSERQGDNVFDGQTHILNTPFLRVVGQFDPNKLPGFSSLSRVPLETYYPPLLTAGNAASRKALHGKPLQPTQNLGDYVQQPPLFLTTIASLSAFLNAQYWHGVPAAERKAPISAIRVRVTGVTGADSRSIARINSVALRIHELTGLDVDITAGSSPHPLTIALPAGKFGRPALLLREAWSKKGVSLSFLRGVDRKQLALFALIPLICCLFLGNGAFAAVRTRRGEIGTLLTLGWSRRVIFRFVLGEIVLVGFVAGLVGLAVAVLLVEAFGLDASLAATVLVVPMAVGLAFVAGLVPAWRAASGRPLDALRPTVRETGSAVRVRSLAALSVMNLRRVPARVALGSAALAVGVCALTVLVAVERAFDGVLAGTVLGDAISVQIRGFDYLALGLVMGLAALSVADVLYLNLRERQAELVTLRTLGWRPAHLARMIVLEAALIGVGASTVGTLAGALLGTLVIAAPVAPVAIAALIGLGGGVAAALLASLLPLAQLDRLTPPAVLAADQ